MRSCVGFACPINAKGGTQNTVIPAALATGNCELRTDAVVKEVVVDERGCARGVVYFDARDRLQNQTADLVVVAASATETARLLLNSKSRLFPNGAGNNHDWVGRNLQATRMCARKGSWKRMFTRRPDRGRAWPSAISVTVSRGCAAVRCSATGSSAPV
jgi:choline dehydrogenase-like flavoprotein